MPSEEHLDERQAELFEHRLAEQDRAHPGYREAWLAFAALVLGHGGRRIVPPVQPDVLIGMLTTDAELIDGGSAELVEGEPSDCHVNAARLWRAGRSEAIGTGYALSDDGLWREHSWGVRAGRVIETTTPRLRYFGVVMADDRATWFADWVDPAS